MPSPGCCPAWPSRGCFPGAEGGEGLFPLVGWGEAVGRGNKTARDAAASRLGMGVAVGLCGVWEEVGGVCSYPRTHSLVWERVLLDNTGILPW